MNKIIKYSTISLLVISIDSIIPPPKIAFLEMTLNCIR